MKNKKILIVGIVVFMIVVFLVVFKDKILKIIYPKTYKEIVSVYAEKYNVNENIIFSVIKAESNFKNDAVSHKEALGLMQIMEETAKDVAIKYDINIDLNNVEQEILNVQNNINIGTKYLSVLI